MFKMKYFVGLITAALAVVLYKNYSIKQPPEIGSIAPNFELQDAGGEAHALTQYFGQWVVLYFYPKDDTPGCTKEACHFRDDFAKFKAKGVKVLGVSLDSQSDHADFKQKYQLPFTLLADVDGEVAAEYGALMHLGVTKMAKRYTFLIDPDGRIAKAYLSVNPDQHAQEVFADLENLTAG